MIVDSSFFISFFIKEDVNHEKAVNKFEEIKEELIIPETVLEEIFTVLCYKKGVKFAVRAINLLKETDGISIYYFEKDEIEEIFKFIDKINKKLSFEDYSVVYLSKLMKKKILGFDKELTKIKY